MSRPSHERPLVAFTLLIQLAVGAFVAASALDLLTTARSGQNWAEARGHAAFVAIAASALAGLVVSFLHLGTPRHAWRALVNLRRSWLSREILFAAGFTALTALFAALRTVRAAPPSSRSAVAAAAALCGVALVYSMTRVYRLRTMPAWDTPLTTLAFFSATGLLGSLAAGAAVALWAGGSAAAADVSVLAGIAAGGFVIEIGLETTRTVDWTRLLLLAVGVAFTIWAMLGAGPPGPSLAAAFVAAAAALVIARLRFFHLAANRPL